MGQIENVFEKAFGLLDALEIIALIAVEYTTNGSKDNRTKYAWNDDANNALR